MTEKLQNIIKEEVMKLPKEAQEAINAFDWVKATEEIGTKFSLSENEITNFQVETLLILTGIEYADSYTNNIENEIGTTKADAEKITKEAVEKIFIPINNIFLKNVKKSGKDKTANAEQNLNFVLSGGDYSAFVNPPRLDKEGTGLPAQAGSSDSPRQYSGEGQGVRSGEVNPIPKKMDDIRSKFTI